MIDWYEEMERAEQEYDAKLADEAMAYQDGYQQGKADAIVEALEPYDAESIEDLVENAYKKGKADANAKIGPTIKEIHDGVYEEGQRHGKEELLRRLDNCRFGKRGGLLNWSDVLKCFEVEE